MSGYKMNETVYINGYNGRYTPALFKGDIDGTLCYVKPKKLFERGGYGVTITCLARHLTRKPAGNVQHEGVQG